MKFKILTDLVALLGLLCLGFVQPGNIITFKNAEISNIGTERLIENDCDTPNGSRGNCIILHECPALLALIINREQHEFLKQSQCGWDQDRPLVCCGDESSTNKERNCSSVELHWCKSDKDECCVPELTYNINETVTKATALLDNISHCEMSSIPPESTSECCGREATILKILPGETTLMDQYPWTTLIEYTSTDIIEIKCGGALISARYVLTSAHCMFFENWTPVKVRLGDFDIDNQGIDCVNESGNVDCSDGAVTIPIEKITPHPDYIFDSRSQADDIALVRLQTNAPYTDFIRPICLPMTTSDFTESDDSNVKLRVSGWGFRSNKQEYVQRKQQVELTFVSLENCSMSYRQMNVVLGEGHICAGGKNSKDSCKGMKVYAPDILCVHLGDSGGALMLMKDQRTEIVGIASFSPCGHRSKPAVYAKVLHYLPWIRSNIY